MQQQIPEEEDPGHHISRTDANQLIPSIESAYIGLQMQGKYLPKQTSSIITADYLLAVLFEECYVPETNDIKIGVLLRPVKKYQVLEELTQIELDENQRWGIDQKHQPDKQWAVNVLRTLRPHSPLFKKYSPEKFDMKQFTQEQLMKIKSLDLSQGKKGAVRRFFRVSKDKALEIQQKRKTQQKKNLQKKYREKKK